MALGTMNREGSLARSSQMETRSLRGSTADGARSKTPPGTPKKCGKLLGVRVLMLDDTVTLFQVQSKASGRILFEQACKQLNLLETDYFGLEYNDNKGATFWVDRDKPMNQQIGLNSSEPLLRFMVKFYIPDPSQLEEEYTRYLFSLQIKRDLATGHLQCNDNTAALMASYIVQAQCGDYVVEDYPDHTYLSSENFVPGQDAELERRICENHKKHTGQSPMEADLNLLETARRCELYGVKLHLVKDHEGVTLGLAVAHLGILVFQGSTKINTFSWAKVRKLSFKRKKFLIKLHPEGYGYYKDIVEFYFDERNHCKNFWKKCVEHHGFFRCTDIPQAIRDKSRIISRGSSFRYSGRTQKQMQEHVRENFVKRQSFQRHVRSLHGSSSNVGSVSAQPILPGVDNDMVGVGLSTPVSFSCGSITVCSDDPHSFCSLGSMGHSVSRLRDFNDYEESPFSIRRPSSHTAYIPDQTSPCQVYSESHLPNFHHDHLHHAGQDVIGVSTLQPNTQRRERAREALLRRNCDHNVSIDSGQSHSGSSRTTENPTEQTVVHRQVGGGTGRTQLHPGTATHLSTHSLHSVHSASGRCEEEQNSDSHLSEEDNLSHESYDLLDKEEEAHMNTYSENIKTVLSRSEISFDNSLSYSIPHTPSKIPTIDDNVIRDIEQSCHSSYREDLINSNLNCHSKPTSHSSTYSSLSTSPLPDSQTALARRRSSGSGTLSQRSKNSKESVKSSDLKAESRVSLRERESHFLSEDCSEGFHGHEIHLESSGASASPHHGQPWPEKIINKNHQQQKALDPVRDSGMHENIIFQSPTNIKYFSPQIHHQQAFSSRTLPNRRRRDKSPVVFTTGKLSVDCSSASSSSQASPRMCRPKSLDFSVVALQDLPQTDAYSYRDDTIEQHDFEDNSSSTFSVQNNYASSSDVPGTPELGGVELASSLASRSHISGKPIPTFNSAKHQSFPFHALKQERIYDIPEGIERDEIPENSPSAPTETRGSFQNVAHEKPKCYKNYLEITRKFSSEESESTSHKPRLKILPPPRVLKKVSSTESESAISNNSHQSLPPVQFDSDTLSLPLDLISPPLESESSTALAESESLPAPPQFGSNKDDTDIEDDVTPRGEETNSESQDQIGRNNFSLEQPEKSKFGVRVAPPALQNIELVPPTRQESTYETRAERMLESQLTRVDTFTDDHTPRTREIVDLDKQLVNGKRRENVLLKALDSYDSFNNDPLQLESRQESLTYEESAESALEKQTTVESFTSQMSADNDVFYESIESIENKVQELNDPNFTNRRDQILESQSTFESFTTECEVLITKRQESTYEERAETVLESQNTIESFTNEVPNDEVFDHEPPCSESSFLHDDCETQIEKTDEDLVAEMYVRHLRDPDCESDLDNVPFMDDTFDQDLLISSGGKVACGQGDRIIYNNFVKFPAEERVETVYVEPPSCEDVVTEDENAAVTGAYDSEPPPPLPPDDFGTFTVPHEPLYYRDGFRGAFPMRTLSRISEKSSNESASTPSDTPAAGYDHSDHEQNYTTSEDNENAPSISSDLPENMAPDEDSVIPNPLDDLRVEFGCDNSPPESSQESPKITECTQLDQDTLEDDEEEDLDETNAEEIKTEERDLPPGFRPELTNSITSENDVTNKDSDGSLHDSMEILEEVNTEDRFDHDLNRCSFEGSEGSQHQIQWRVTIPKSNMRTCQSSSKPTLLKKPSVSLSENSGKYVVTEGSEEVIL